MEFDFEALSQGDRYKLMTGTIIPRPIAFCTSISPEGVVNAAPFSFFNGMSSDPPVLVLGIEIHPAYPVKDTGRNIRDTGEFAVNLVSEEIGEAMNICAADFPPETNELEEAGLTAVPCTKIKAPRIAESPVTFECVLHDTVAFGGGKMIVVGRVVHFHIKDHLINKERLHVDAPAMNLIGRLHGRGWYVRLTDTYEIKRVTYEQVKQAKGET